MEDISSLSGSVIIEDLKDISTLKCRKLQHSSADLAQVHCSSKLKSRMSENRNKNTESSSDSFSLAFSTSLKDKLSLKPQSNLENKKVKNGVNFKLGTADVEVHCGGSTQNYLESEENDVIQRRIKLSELNNISSQEKDVNCGFDKYSDIVDIHSKNIRHSSTISNSSNSILSNGYRNFENNSSNSLDISEYSISSGISNTDDTSHSSISSGGAKPRTKTNSKNSLLCQENEEELLKLSTHDKSRKENARSNSTSIPVSLQSPTDDDINVVYMNYQNENQMDAIIKLIQKDLSEPYSIYTYRYFIHNWPKLCFLAYVDNEVIGAIVCKLDLHKKVTVRGYIAMLAVDERFRKRKIGSNLVQRAIREMAADDADEVVLETEITNTSALQLYQNLGFVRDKRLFRYYLNGVDALRLKLWLS